MTSRDTKCVNSGIYRMRGRPSRLQPLTLFNIDLGNFFTRVPLHRLTKMSEVKCTKHSSMLQRARKWQTVCWTLGKYMKMWRKFRIIFLIFAERMYVGHVSQHCFSYNYAKVDISKNKLLGKGNILCLKCYSQV